MWVGDGQYRGCRKRGVDGIATVIGRLLTDLSGEGEGRVSTFGVSALARGKWQGK